MTRARMKRTLSTKEFMRYKHYRDRRLSALIKDGKIASAHVVW